MITKVETDGLLAAGEAIFMWWVEPENAVKEVFS
jgi:hypothetical protein